MFSKLLSADKKNSKVKAKLKSLSVLWALVLVCILASIFSGNFAKLDNIINVLRAISINGIIALGMTFVVLTGGVDLSVGSALGVVGIVTSMLFQAGASGIVGIAGGLLTGIVIGFLNSLGITKGKLPSFIMTLGSLTALRGVSLILSNGYPQNWRHTNVDIKFIGQGYFLGIPVPVYIFVVLFLLGFYVLRYTRFGRNVYAVGDNREAARLNGVNIEFTEGLCFMITGLASAIASIVLIAKLSSADPSNGTGYELNALAMVYIGGCSTAGGTGTIVGTLLGAMLLSVLSNVQNLLGISPYVQQLVEGLIIIIAVLLGSIGNRKQ